MDVEISVIASPGKETGGQFNPQPAKSAVIFLA
jgi:hypothetical protein